MDVEQREHMDTGRGASHIGVCWGAKGGTAGVGGLGMDNMGEMSDIGDGGMEAANHIAMHVPIQQSCMICTCTPEPKVQYIYEKIF